MLFFTIEDSVMTTSKKDGQQNNNKKANAQLMKQKTTESYRR